MHACLIAASGPTKLCVELESGTISVDGVDPPVKQVGSIYETFIYIPT